MIKFNQIESKKYSIFDGEEKIVELNFVQTSLTNKFNIISGFIERMSEDSEEFTNWFKNFIIEYYSELEKFKVLEKNIEKIKTFVNNFIDKQNINFEDFVDESKSKKNSILFTPDEIELIIKTSSYLKIYSILSNSEQLSLDYRSHKFIYNMICSEIMDSNIVSKIFTIIKTKTYRYNITDKFMWEYIKNVQCKSIDDHVTEIFNFVMNNILILCEETKNPIIYILSVVDESVKWFLRTIYKDSIIYDDEISSDDLFNSNSKDILKTFAYNDTLARLKIIAKNKIFQKIEKNIRTHFESNMNKSIDDELINVQNRLKNVKAISPISNCIVFPILSKITEIPYDYFEKVTPEEALTLSIYLQDIMKNVFEEKYKNLISILEYYPEQEPAIATTYNLKDVMKFINTAETKKFFGFKSKMIFSHAMRYYIGRISRLKFSNIFTNQRLNVQIIKLESEIIDFFTHWFAEEMEENFKKMQKFVDYDF